MTEEEFQKKNRKKIEEMIAKKLESKSESLEQRLTVKNLVASNGLKGIALYASSFFFGGFIGYSAIQTIKSYSKVSIGDIRALAKFKVYSNNRRQGVKATSATKKTPIRPVIDNEGSATFRDSFKEKSGEYPVNSRTLVNLKSPMVPNKPVDYEIYQKMGESKKFVNKEQRSIAFSQFNFLFKYKEILGTNIELVKEMKRSREDQEFNEEIRKNDLFSMQAINLQLSESLMADPRFKVIGANVETPKKIFNIFKHHTIPQSKTWIKSHFRITGDIRIVFRGQVVEMGEKIKLITDEETILYKIGRRDTLFGILGKLGYAFDKTNIEEILIYPVSERYVINEDNYGFYQIKEKLGTIFHKDVNFNDPYLREQLSILFSELIQPITDAFLTARTEIMTAQGSFEALERFIKWYYLKQFSNMEEYKDANPQEKAAMEEFINRIFNEKFKTRFDNTRAIKGDNYIESLFIESIQYAALMFFFEKIGAGINIDAKNLPHQIESFLFYQDSKSDLNILKKEFLNVEMPRILLRYAESFETGDLAATMQFSRIKRFQIGWEHETMTLISIAPYFLMKAFIENGYDLDNLELYYAFSYAPESKRVSGLIEDMEKILNNKDFSDILKALYNDVDLFNGRDNFRLTDIISVLIPSYGMFNVECKNSLISSSDYLKDVVVDVFTTIFPALYRSIAIEDINVEDQFEHMVVAIDPNERTAMTRLINKLVGLRKPTDLRASQIESEEHMKEGEGPRKGPKLVEFYSRVADLINEKMTSNDLESAKRIIASLFKKDSFISELNKITKDIFALSDENAKKYVNLVEDKFLTRSINPNAENKLKSDIDNLFHLNPDGIYKVVLDVSLNVYKATNIKLTEDLLKNVGFFVINGEIKSQSQLTKDELGALVKGSLAVVHRKGKGGYENGLILVNKPEINLPNGVAEGFRNPSTSEIIEGVFVSRYDKTSDQSYLLFGQVRLNPLSAKLEAIATKISDREAIMAKYLDQAVIEQSITLAGALEIKKYYTLEYVRSACQTAGPKVSYVLQQVHSRIIPTDAHKKIISGVAAVNYFRGKPKIEQTKIDLYNIENLRYELAGLFALLLELETIYDKGEVNPPTYLFPENLNELVYFGVVGRKIVDSLLSFHGGSYSLQHITEVFAKLSPTKEDLEKINRPESLKSLFSTYLKLIVNKENDHLFQQYIKQLKDINGNFKAFSTGIDVTTEDFLLIEILDGIMNELLSYPGFTLITSGLFRIRADYTIEFDAPTLANLGKRFQKIGLKFTTDQKPESGPYRKYFFNSIRREGISMVDYFMSIIVFGHYKVALVEGEYKALFSKPPVNTLIQLYNNYQFSRQSYKYYYEIRIELKKIYYSQLSKFEESLSLDRILDAFYAIPSIKIYSFLSNFDQYLKDIPFEVSKHTILNFINYYDLNWKIQGDIIFNEDFKEPAHFTKLILDRLISSSEVFSRIDTDQLAEILELDVKDLKYFIIHFKHYLESKGVRLKLSSGFRFDEDEWVDNLNKI